MVEPPDAVERSPFEYAIVRIVPRVERGEALNAGIVLMSRARRFLGAPAASDGVEILSDLPDVGDFFRRIHVLVYAPRRGSGLKIKVAEALAFGRGVVTTVDGTEGLGLEDGEHVLLGATDTELASAASEMLLDGDRCRRLARAGRRAIGELLSPERTTGLMEDVYSSVSRG